MDSTCDIEFLRKQFFHGIPVNKIRLKENDTNYKISEELQKLIIESTVNDTLVNKYPIKRSYQQAFVKMIINKLEEIGAEVHEEVYNSYCKLIETSVNESSTTHFRHVLIPDEDVGRERIFIQENSNIISDGTTGLCTWQASFWLGEWCASQGRELKGKVILELGSGVGLAGLVIVRLCQPRRYVFSDCHSSVLHMLCKNVTLNCSQISGDVSVSDENCYRNLKLQLKRGNSIVEVIEFNWEEVDELLNENFVEPDVIVAADILYDESVFPILIKTFKLLMIKNNCYVIIAATIRNPSTYSRFFVELENQKVRFEEITIPAPKIFIPPDDIVKIFKLTIPSNCNSLDKK